MKRKIIQQRGSFTITLPKDWVKRFRLKGGDEIDLSVVDFNLLIKAPGIKEFRETEIEITEKTKPALFKTLLAHIYRKGYDKIRINIYSDALIPEIEGIVDKFFLGFAVVEKRKKYCVIENIAEPTEEKYDVLIRRSFLLIKEMAAVIYEDLQSGNYPNLFKIEGYSNNLDKFVFFCRRVISKGMFTRGDSQLYWQMLTFLMHIGRSYLALYVYLSKQRKFSVSRQTLDLFNKKIQFFQLFYDAYHQKSVELITEMVSRKDDLLYGKGYKVLENTNGPEAVVAYHIREIIRLTFTCSSPVLAMIV
ncbi:hypothetical protein KY319_03165 [Candidatus Woesearchaeota archaeon]|nr:hypothetical protein [Candidatus Woesearchaeota archaeon]MBW3022269.1 hypothetical protein [Candidatus Woesearchaeota archaeon]